MFKSKKLRIYIPFRNFRKADYDAINGFFLTVDWNTIFSHYFSAKDLYSYFLELVKTAIDMFVPLVSYKKSYCPSLRKLLSKKKNLWKKYKATRSAFDLNKYKKCDALFKQESANLKIKEESDILKNNNVRSFYKFMNCRLKNSKTAPFLIDVTKNVYSEDIEKAELFNDYFSSDCLLL